MEPVMIDPADAEALVSRARSGDRAAFDELAARVRDRLLARIGGEVGPKLREKVGLDDVLQEVLLRGFESIQRLEGRDEATFLSWLEGIARNVVRNLARQKGVKKELALTQDQPGSDISPSRQLRRQERFDRLSKAVEGLSPDYRTVIRLARIDGLKIREIAARMNRSPSAVKNLLLRAMGELRKTFGDTESLNLPDRRMGEEKQNHGE
jgi:RNA polymerase sigma-70 factor (ECF subfamily)